MSYNRSYENITLTYSLPFRRFHPSFILKEYVDRIALEKGISPEEVIDYYVGIYIQDLNKNVTKMIKHDGNKIFHSSPEDCIIDDKINEKWIKEEFGRES